MIDFSTTTEMEGEIPEGISFEPELIEGELVPFDYGNQIALAKRPLDLILTAIRKDFEAYQTDLDDLVEKALALHVIDEASDQSAVMLGTSAQGLKKKIEKRCDYIVDEPNSFVTTVRNLKNGFTKSLATMMDNLGRKRDAFIAVEKRRKEALRLQAEKEIQELQEKTEREEQERREAEAKEKNVPVGDIPKQEVFFPKPVVEQPKTTVRSSSGSGTGYQKKQLYIEVTDFSKIDDKYKVLVDSGAVDTTERPRGSIKDDFKAGIREFSGLIVEEREKSQFRSK